MYREFRDITRQVDIESLEIKPHKLKQIKRVQRYNHTKRYRELRDKTRQTCIESLDIQPDKQIQRV